MRLRKARVQHYRAIVDSGDVEVEDRVTVLIGKNEQGKTTFLKGLASSNAGATYKSSDLPNHLTAELEQQKPSTIPIVTLWLEPESEDLEELVRLLKTVDDVSAFKFTKYYDGSRRFGILTKAGSEDVLKFPTPDFQTQIGKFRSLATALNEKLTAHGERQAEFKNHLSLAQTQVTQFVEAKFDDPTQIENIIRTFATGLTAVPGQDQAIQTDIAATVLSQLKIPHQQYRWSKNLFDSSNVFAFYTFYDGYGLITPKGNLVWDKKAGGIYTTNTFSKDDFVIFKAKGEAYLQELFQEYLDF